MRRRAGELRAGSGGVPVVVPAKPAGLGDHHDIAELRPVRRARHRTVHPERAAATPTVVVLKVVGEQPAEVTRAEDDDVVKALAADAADDPLGEGFSQGL